MFIVEFLLDNGSGEGFLADLHFNPVVHLDRSVHQGDGTALFDAVNTRASMEPMARP